MITNRFAVCQKDNVPLIYLDQMGKVISWECPICKSRWFQYALTPNFFETYELLVRWLGC